MDQQLCCFKGGHESNLVAYICLDIGCGGQRLFCEICFKQKVHTHNQKITLVKIQDFYKNIDLKYKTIIADQEKLQQWCEKYTNLLELFTTSTQFLLGIIHKEIGGLQFHASKINQYKEVLNRNIKDEILQSKQFERAVYYETDIQLFKELDDYYSQQESEIHVFNKFIKKKLEENEEQKYQYNLEEISQCGHKFYNQTILNITSKQAYTVQKTIPKGDYFFIQEQQFCFKFFTPINGNNAFFNEGQIISLSEIYQDKQNSGFYKITDNGKYVIHCRERSKINIIKFNNQKPYLHKKMNLYNQQICQILVCEEQYIIIQDRQNITLCDMESKNQTSRQQLFISGEIQYVQQHALLVIPEGKSMKFFNIQFGEK